MRAALILVLGWLVFLSNPARAAELYYLYIPSITGTVDEPGYSGLIPVTSFSFNPTTDYLNVNRLSDSTSPHLFTAAVTGTYFPTADVLVYEAPDTEPSQIYEMTGAVISSDVPLDTVLPQEVIGIKYTSFEFVPVVPVGPPGPVTVPEPSTWALMLVGLLSATGLAEKRKSQTVRYSFVEAR